MYNDVYIPYLNNTTRLQIFFGGSSSGKSVFLSQRCVEDLLQGHRNYLIVRKIAATLKSSVFNEVCKTIIRYNVSRFFHIDKQEMIITCKLNQMQALFKGMDDEEKVKSITPIKGVITDVWAEEVTEIDRFPIMQLFKRLRGKSAVPKRMIFSFNPIYKTHWIFKEYFEPIGWEDSQREYHDEHISILKTTYKDNLRFLEDDDVYALEHEPDLYFREVYTYGNWGILGHPVFTNWKVVDIHLLVKKFTNIKNGLDFGFTAPTAFIRSHYDRDNETIYIFQEWQKKQAQDKDIFNALKPICGSEIITADSNDPKTREALNDMGLNIIPAIKGKGSKMYGIKWLQSKTIIIDPSCQGMINEANTYQWKIDKNGDISEEPVKKNDHFWSALRYSYESEFGERVYSWA
jgi:phage terminase large subunit